MNYRKEVFEEIKRDYVQSYAYGICQFLQRLAPDEFNKVFGSLENCVREVVDDAELWIEQWPEKYLAGIIARVKSFKK